MTDQLSDIDSSAQAPMVQETTEPQSSDHVKRWPASVESLGLILALITLGVGITASWMEWGPKLKEEPKPSVTMTVDGEPVDNVAEGIGAALGDVAVGFGKRIKDRVLNKEDQADQPQEGLSFTPSESEVESPAAQPKSSLSLPAVLGFVAIATGVLAIGIGVLGIARGGSKAVAGFTIAFALLGALLQAPIILGIALAVIVLVAIRGLHIHH